MRAAHPKRHCSRLAPSKAPLSCLTSCLRSRLLQDSAAGAPGLAQHGVGASTALLRYFGIDFARGAGRGVFRAAPSALRPDAMPGGGGGMAMPAPGRFPLAKRARVPHTLLTAEKMGVADGSGIDARGGAPIDKQ